MQRASFDADQFYYLYILNLFKPSTGSSVLLPAQASKVRGPTRLTECLVTRPRYGSLGWYPMADNRCVVYTSSWRNCTYCRHPFHTGAWSSATYGTHTFRRLDQQKRPARLYPVASYGSGSTQTQSRLRDLINRSGRSCGRFAKDLAGRPCSISSTLSFFFPSLSHSIDAMHGHAMS